MDFSRDELRRQLRDSEFEHRAAMKPWREALLCVFGSESRIPAEAKAELLGVPVPGRRQFFKIGGATVLGAAVLAACSDDDGGGTDNGAGSATDTDITLLRTASSLELLAVQTYDTAIGSGLVTNPDIAGAATLFRNQHEEHARQLQSATTDAGGSPYTKANPVLKRDVVDPAIAGLMDEMGVVAFALTLENVAAQTYAFAAGALSTPAFRKAIMAIGGVEARHAAVLSAVLGQPTVPAPFLSTTQAVTESAFV